MLQTKTARANAARRAFKLGLPLIVGAICLTLVHARLKGLEPRAMLDAIAAISMGQWVAAIGATGISFWAVGRYDAVMHRHFRTGIPRSQALRAGAASIALSQVLGMGVLTGALARWRILPALSGRDATRIAAAVAVSFLAGWAVVTALAGLLLPGAMIPVGATLAVLMAALLLAYAGFTVPVFSVLGRDIRLPSLPAMTAVLGLTALDTLAAAAALAMLLPAATAPGFELIFPAYLLALGAALLTGTPGGVGPFELALLTLLPQVPEADLMVGILAFRLVYYALPALIALGPLAWPSTSRSNHNILKNIPFYQISPLPKTHIINPRRAELGVTRQNRAFALHAAGSSAAVLATGQCMTLLFAPTRGGIGPLLRPLAAHAGDHNKRACAYKISARDAVIARRAGWVVLHIADEAVIDTAHFDLGTPRHRQLRRKLRQAQKSGVSIRRIRGPLPHRDLARIDAAWQAEHGRARGITIGRYSENYVDAQTVYTAYLNQTPIAFVTLHASHHERCLDLMRHTADMPDGTMQALIVTAIQDARDQGCQRVSLAAMPAIAPARHPRIHHFIARRSGGLGLVRFKCAFGARAEPLYAAAPGPVDLAMALGDLACAIRSPDQRHDHQTIAFDPQT